MRVENSLIFDRFLVGVCIFVKSKRKFIFLCPSVVAMSAKSGVKFGKMGFFDGFAEKGGDQFFESIVGVRSKFVTKLGFKVLLFFGG